MIFFTKNLNKNLKKYFCCRCFFRVGGGVGGARVIDFFTKNLNKNKKKIFLLSFFSRGGGG